MKYVESLGYKVELLEAYSFKRGKPFKQFVTTFFGKRTDCKARGDAAGSLIAKLMLNSLYGKAGMKPVTNETTITNTTDTIVDINLKYTCVHETPLENNACMVDFDLEPNDGSGISEEIYKQLFKTWRDALENHTSCVQLAAAVTAYARVELDKYMRIPGIDVVYCDTDSVVVNKPLPASLLGSGLGQMKNEMASYYPQGTADKLLYFTEAVFLAPKVYMIRIDTPKGTIYDTGFKGVDLRDVNKQHL